MNLKVGDIVTRKSYGGDIFFKVVDIKNDGKENIITLKGISYRIEADAPENDLMVMTDQHVRQHRSRMYSVVDNKCRQMTEPLKRSGSKKFFLRGTSKDNARNFSRPGKVLHIDGDNDYLESCLEQYRKFGIDVVGKFVPEKDQASAVYKLLTENKPDILVLTGHDGVIKGDESSFLNPGNYRNSAFYAAAVKEARRYDCSLDSLVIFAGACQSMYDSIISAGANFASAPYRVLIHALDPVFVCQKVAFEPIDKVLSPNDVIDNTITGMEGIGGLQTRGKHRMGFPQEPYTK